MYVIRFVDRCNVNIPSLKPLIRSKLEFIALIGGFTMILSGLWHHYEADKRTQGQAFHLETTGSRSGPMNDADWADI